MLLSCEVSVKNLISLEATATFFAIWDLHLPWTARQDGVLFRLRCGKHKELKT